MILKLLARILSWLKQWLKQWPEPRAPDGRSRFDWDREGDQIDTLIKTLETGQRQCIDPKYREAQKREGKPICYKPGPNYYKLRNNRDKYST